VQQEQLMYETAGQNPLKRSVEKQI